MDQRPVRGGWPWWSRPPVLRSALGQGEPGLSLAEPTIWMRPLLGGHELTQPADALSGDGSVEGGEEDLAGGMTQLSESDCQFVGLGPVEILAPVLGEKVVLEDVGLREPIIELTAVQYMFAGQGHRRPP